MPYKSSAQRAYMHIHHPDIAARWDKEYPNQGKLPKHVKKMKLVVNNKLKGALGASQFTKDNKPTGKIEINVKKHKGDKRELASTIKHEMLHVKHPKMTEKDAYKKSKKTAISPMEQNKLIAKLRMKKINYKMGAIKRKFKVAPSENIEPGTLINKSKELSKQNLAIRGLI